MSRKRLAIGLTISLGAVTVTWILGWGIWQSARLWDIVDFIEYQNMMYILVTLIAFMGLGFTLKHRKVPLQRRPRKRVVRKAGQNPVDLEPIEARVKELEEKMADVHAMTNFMKTMKEKEGDKS